MQQAGGVVGVGGLRDERWCEAGERMLSLISVSG